MFLIPGILLAAAIVLSTLFCMVCMSLVGTTESLDKDLKAREDEVFMLKMELERANNELAVTKALLDNK